MGKNSNRFMMYFGVVKTIVLAIVVLGSIAIIGVDIAMLLGKLDMLVTMPAVGGVSIAAASIVAIIALLVIFNSAYILKDESLVIVLGIFVDKIGYDAIELVRQNSETKECYVIVTSDKQAEGNFGYRLNLNAQKSDEFLVKLREHRHDLLVEVFTPEKKDKTKK